MNTFGIIRGIDSGLGHVLKFKIQDQSLDHSFMDPLPLPTSAENDSLFKSAIEESENGNFQEAVNK